MKADRGLTIKRMVQLGRVSRSGYYRLDGRGPEGAPDRDMDLRDAIQRIALEWPSYGRPRVTRELRRRGWTVNPKRVYRLLREDNLLCVRKRKFVVTTDSNHTRRIYPNLAPELILTATDQLWRADITYIRLRDEFVFLAVILDAYSRRVIGWRRKASGRVSSACRPGNCSSSRTMLIAPLSYRPRSHVELRSSKPPPSAGSAIPDCEARSSGCGPLAPQRR